ETFDPHHAIVLIPGPASPPSHSKGIDGTQRRMHSMMRKKRGQPINVPRIRCRKDRSIKKTPVHGQEEFKAMFRRRNKSL
ncbi:unnamed protein product, partial [Musa acuminata var. zebrina]